MEIEFELCELHWSVPFRLEEAVAGHISGGDDGKRDRDAGQRVATGHGIVLDVDVQEVLIAHHVAIAGGRQLLHQEDLLGASVDRLVAKNACLLPLCLRDNSLVLVEVDCHLLWFSVTGAWLDPRPVLVLDDVEAPLKVDLS